MEKPGDYNDNCFYVEYFGPTNTRGARIKISTFDATETRRGRMFPFDDGIGDTGKQALGIIRGLGLEVVAFNGRHPTHYVIMTKWDPNLERVHAFLKKGAS